MAKHHPRISTAGRFVAAFENWKRRVFAWVSDRLLTPLFEPVLHPTHRRIRTLGFTALIGHPLFYVAWADWLPQPYESLPLRLMLALSGVFLALVPGNGAMPPTPARTAIFAVLFWINLPWFFWLMYFCNSGNPVWLASVGAMILIYYAVTDWRLATIGTFSGLVIAFLMFEAFGPPVALPGGDGAATAVAVLGFCWYMAISLGVSASNLRREQLNQTLGTIGVMAHELRTPLATMQLIADAVRREAGQPEEGHAEKLEKLAERLNILVRNMNHQIDMQINNARLLRLPQQSDAISAAELVQQSLETYPFRSTKERATAVLRVHNDFRFRGSRALFGQVMNNLTKNALRSISCGTGSGQPGDLLIEVGAQGERGRIVITDRGIGMEHALQERIFQPFFSTSRGTSQGLGLAFCQRVVQSARGSIRVSSAPLKGAIFTIELPVA